MNERTCLLTDVINNHGINVRNNDYEWEDTDLDLTFFNVNGRHTIQQSLDFLNKIEEQWREFTEEMQASAEFFLRRGK